jgi:hypothetical protein
MDPEIYLREKPDRIEPAFFYPIIGLKPLMPGLLCTLQQRNPRFLPHLQHGPGSSVAAYKTSKKIRI